MHSAFSPPHNISSLQKELAYLRTYVLYIGNIDEMAFLSIFLFSFSFSLDPVVMLGSSLVHSLTRLHIWLK